jgi:hypothetical protein
MDKVKAQFSLSDPIDIAVIKESENCVSNPGSLSLLYYISEEVSALENINSDRLTSLTTENKISGTENGLQVAYFLMSFPSHN